MLNLIGESVMLNGGKLIVNVLGNHLPEDNEGYNPCLEIMFDDNRIAWDWYCKGIRIKVSKSALQECESKGFKRVLFSDCQLTELSKEEVNKEVEEFTKKYSV